MTTPDLPSEVELSELERLCREAAPPLNTNTWTGEVGNAPIETVYVTRADAELALAARAALPRLIAVARAYRECLATLKDHGYEAALRLLSAKGLGEQP